MTSAGKILGEAIDIPGYGEDPVRFPPYVEDLGGGVTVTTGEDGVRTWRKDGKIHRDGDLPAVEGANTQVWYENDAVHRDGDKPAAISDGTQAWFDHGDLHRDGDKPAIIADDKLIWFEHGQVHRDHAPALIWCKGGNPAEWHVHGAFVTKARLSPAQIRLWSQPRPGLVKREAEPS